MDTLAIIINYCSNEKMFLEALLRNVTKITDTVVVSYGNKMYDGTDEDIIHMQLCKFKYPSVTFVQYDVDLTLNKTEMRGVVNRRLAYYHNLARYTAVQALPEKIEWVLVLDADEIPEADRFKAWFLSSTLSIKNAYKLCTYWYFKEAIFQAKTWEDSILLIHKSHLTEDNIFHDNERDDLIRYSGVTLIRGVTGLDELPLFHHFSWVRGKEGLRKKMNSWAHKGELFPNKTTDEIIDIIYKDGNPNDIIHNYSYNVVRNNLR